MKQREPQEAKKFRGKARKGDLAGEEVYFHRKALEAGTVNEETGWVEAFDNCWQLWIVSLEDWDASPHL